MQHPRSWRWCGGYYWACALLLIGTPLWAGAGPSREDWNLALGAKKKQDYKIQLQEATLKKLKAMTLDQLKASAKSWIDEKFDKLPEEGRGEIRKKVLDYLYENQGDLDLVAKNSVDGKSEEALARMGDLFGKAVVAATELGEPGSGGLVDSAWAAGQDLKQLLEPVAQISKGMGRLAEGDFSGAGEEFALAVPGVKMIHDRVKIVADKEKKVFDALVDESYGEIYRRWKEVDGTKDVRETQLLFEASNSGGLLDLLKKRYGWRSDRAALSRLNAIFTKRYQAEQAAEKEFRSNIRLQERAERLSLILLPKPLPPPGKERTKALKGAFEEYRQRVRELRAELASDSGLALEKITFEDMISLLQSQTGVLRAVREDENESRLYYRKAFRKSKAALLARWKEGQAEAKRKQARARAWRRSEEASAEGNSTALPGLDGAEAGARKAMDCENIPEEAVAAIEQRLLRAEHSELVSLATRLKGRKDRGSLLNCICRAHSSATPSVSVYFSPPEPGETCGDPGDGPCVNSGWGCWRTPFIGDAEALRSCGLAAKVARAICKGGRR
jgi:hypothetical protein